MQGPKAPLAGFVRGAGHFDETVVEAQRVTYRVLPALLVLSVEGKQVHYELINFRKGQHLRGSILYRHRDETYVTVGRLGMSVTPAVRFILARPLQGRVGRVRLGEGAERVASRPHADGSDARDTVRVAAGAERTVPGEAAHAGVVGGRRGAGHGVRAGGRHPDRGTHVEGPRGTLGTAVHRHAHGDAAHGVDGAVRGGHAAHAAGHGRGTAHGTPEAPRLAVQLLRLEHCHRDGVEGAAQQQRSQRDLLPLFPLELFSTRNNLRVIRVIPLAHTAQLSFTLFAYCPVQ